MTLHFPAPEVEKIGKKLIAQHHTHLWKVRVEYLFRETAASHGGKTVLGQARKVSGVSAMLATPGATDSEGLDFFVITIAKDAWDELLTAKQREALVDHELSHCAVVDDKQGGVRLRIEPHDVEEFGAVINRHGLWKPDLSEFLAKLGRDQLEMFTATLDPRPAALAEAA